MEVIILPKADEDLRFWAKLGNKIILKKITRLTQAILQDPYHGPGKPEPLKYQLTGKWSRRITREHRFIYQIEQNTL
jgi:toxin YoeB